MLAVLLIACGGGGDDGGNPAGTSTATVELDHLDASELLARAALSPDSAPDSAHFIVTLNAAVVAENVRLNARTLGAEAPQVQAERAVQSVTARLMGASAGMQAHRIYAHALQGFAVTVPPSEAASFVERLQNDPAVTRIEHDRVASIGAAQTVTTTAPATTVITRSLDNRVWGLDRIDQMALPLNNEFRSSLDGRGVHIYIVDTGISAHDEFGSRLADDGLDAIQDGRGTADCNGHGTHVAGTAAGAMSGVASGATLVPVRVMNCFGSGSVSDILLGFDWIMANGKRPGVVNLSLGSNLSSALDDAVTRLTGAGFTVSVSAGNGNADACTQSPARAPAVLTVASSTSNDARSSFSNFGRCVDLFAPGSAISSAAASNPHGWTTLSGTSMAAPHVTGAAALLLQERPKLTPAQVATQMLYQATPSRITDSRGSPNKLLFTGPGRQLYFPTPWDVHVAQLTPSGKTLTRTSWQASVTVTVHNEDNLPQKDVTVTAQFSNKSNLVTCITTATGACVLKSVNLPTAAADVTLAVTQLSGAAMTYKAATNLRSSTPITRP
ncbi:S8 family peptidase [Sphaerotilus sp.]|uniref:S8 family peptidase n=1 Tax=Sphaerotilus sp. TaxID=2093942 RepID=UPI0034E229A6